MRNRDSKKVRKLGRTIAAVTVAVLRVGLEGPRNAFVLIIPKLLCK